jgi:hypothetical protein
MNKNSKTAAVIIGVLSLAALILIYKTGGSDKPPADLYDDFAKCLTGKGIEMYGKSSCSYCQEEKNNFGDSFKFINYTECSTDPKKCVAKGVNRLPTWIFPDGKKLEGLQGLEKLSRESGCTLPKYPF